MYVIKFNKSLVLHSPHPPPQTVFRFMIGANANSIYPPLPLSLPPPAVSSDRAPVKDRS